MGNGISVLELIEKFEKINFIKVQYKIGKRRRGDNIESYANIDRAKTILKWKPNLDHERMCYDAWNGYLKNG